MLLIQSADNPSMGSNNGLNQTFAKETQKNGSNYGDELQKSDESTDISKGVIHVIRIVSKLSENGKLNTLSHEIFVHVTEDIKRLSELSDGKIKPGTEAYINKLKFTGTSAVPDHKRLGDGKAIEYKNQSNEFDKIYKTKKYSNFYEKDFKNHRQ